MKKRHIAVLMGGPSAEHEVSLNSGRMVARNLDRDKYEVKSIVIKRNGRWPVSLAKLKKWADLAFIVMHGEYGEDGTIQKILEDAGVRFTGSGSKASRLGMDKIAAAEAFAKFGLRVPGEATKLPVVIKPADRGSSVGVSIVKNISEIPAAVKVALAISPNIMFQDFIKGREFTCGVLERNGRIFALPPTEIVPVKSKFFDYRAKYTPGASREVTPPRLSQDKIAAIQKGAILAHKAIGARGLSRTDMIMDKDGRFYILEINTIPGMTKTSLLPQQAAAAGMSFPELLDAIVSEALRR